MILPKEVHPHFELEVRKCGAKDGVSQLPLSIGRAVMRPWYDTFDSNGNLKSGATREDIQMKATQDKIAGREQSMGWNTAPETRNTYWDINPPSDDNKW